MPTLRITLPTLHPAQRRIVAEARRFNVLNCGRRFGKTELGIELELPALQGKFVAWYNNDFPSLSEAWRRTLTAYRPVVKRADAQLRQIEFVGGGHVKFWTLGMDHEVSRGFAYHRVIVDEAARLKKLKEAWLEVIRASLTDYTGDAWFLSTPKGRANYFYDLWLMGQDGPQRDPQFKSWTFPSAANPFLPPSEVVAMAKMLGPRIASQEVYAEFLGTEGRFFDVWETAEKHDEETAHEINSFPIPGHWTPVGGLDWGKANPYACYLGFYDDDGLIVIADECYGARLTEDEQVEQAHRMLERNGRPLNTKIFADPSIFPPKDPKKRVGEYIAERYRRAGLNVVPANNERVNGWARAMRYMTHRDPFDGRAGLRVFKDRCPNLCRTIAILSPDEKNPEDLNTTLEDHAADAALRYLIQRPLYAPKQQEVAIYDTHFRDPETGLYVPVGIPDHLPHALTSDDRREEVFE